MLIPGQKLLKIQYQTDFPLSYCFIAALFSKTIWLGRKSVSNTANFQFLMRLSSIWANFHKLPSWRNTQNQWVRIIARIARIRVLEFWVTIIISSTDLVTWKHLTWVEHDIYQYYAIKLYLFRVLYKIHICRLTQRNMCICGPLLNYEPPHATWSPAWVTWGYVGGRPWWTG